MQDLTGVPGVVDLAAMRDALGELGGDPARINPLVPVELVVDHSVIAEASGTAAAYDENVDIEYQRNIERYQLLRWAQQAFDGFRVVPPGYGHLPPGQPRVPVPGGVRHRRRTGLLRHPGGHRLPHHHGQRTGRARLGCRRDRGRGGHAGPAPVAAAPAGGGLPPHRRAAGRHHRHRPGAHHHQRAAPARGGGQVRRVLRPGVASVPLANRATIGNMSPEYGATCAMFPIDGVTLDYLRFSGRDDAHVALVEAYAKAQGCSTTPAAPSRSSPRWSSSTCRPWSRASPARPGPRTWSDSTGRRPRSARRSAATPGSHAAVRADGDHGRDPGRPRRRGRHHLLHQHLQPPGHGGGRPAGPQRRGPWADVPKPWVKTTLAPGSRVVMDYLDRAGLHRAARRDRLRPRRLRVHDLHRQLGTAAAGRVRGRPGR